MKGADLDIPGGGDDVKVERLYDDMQGGQYEAGVAVPQLRLCRYV